MFKKIFLTMIGVAIVAGCTPKVKTSSVDLSKGNWRGPVSKGLEKIIAENAGKGEYVVFDFDNTTICRDISEAMLGEWVIHGVIKPASLSSELCPDFTIKGKKYSIRTSADITTYYEDFLYATAHHKNDASIYSNSYAWHVQMMHGLTPAQLVKWTDVAFAKEMGKKDCSDSNLGETKAHSYRRPFFFPEMVNLYGNLLKNGYKVYVVSASNVWTVRHMVKEYLVPRIQALYGKDLDIPADHVIGVNTLLRDKRTGVLCKDQQLLTENPKYAAMDMQELANYELTTHIVYPLSGYFGKIANIQKHITMKRPFLIAGDSPNDFPMLKYARNRLWICRMEKNGYQKKFVKTVKECELAGNWFVQPVLYKKSPGFLSTSEGLKKRLEKVPEELKGIEKTVGELKSAGELKAF